MLSTKKFTSSWPSPQLDIHPQRHNNRSPPKASPHHTTHSISRRIQTNHRHSRVLVRQPPPRLHYSLKRPGRIHVTLAIYPRIPCHIASSDIAYKNSDRLCTILKVVLNGPTQFSQHIPHWSIEKAGHQAYRVVVWTGGPWLDVTIETISYRFACVGITLQ
jgi:hypothetical protein